MREEITTDVDVFYDDIMDARQRGEDECTSEFKQCNCLEVMACSSTGEWDEGIHGEKEYHNDPDEWTQQDFDSLIASFKKNGAEYIVVCAVWYDWDEAEVRDYQEECEGEPSPSTYGGYDPDEYADVLDFAPHVYGDGEVILKL